VTVRQGVDDIVKELPAIQDTASKVAAIFDELPDTAAKVSNLHDELPAISDKITAIHDDMPAVANQVTVIHDQLPAIRIALEQLAVRFTVVWWFLSMRILISSNSYTNKPI
jgi:hypothetical protein